MVRNQVMIVLALVTCGLSSAADPRSPAEAAKWADEGGGSVRVIPVPSEDVWQHKTFSPDKKLFAIYFRAGWDEVISTHDAASGKQIRQIVGHGDEVVGFKFSDDGKLLASRCVNGDRAGWAVWDVASGKLLVRLADGQAPKPQDE